MQLFKSQGIREATPSARTRSYRLPWFGGRRPRPAAQAHASLEADVSACVVALGRVQPAHWEDVLTSYDRAA